MAKVKSLVAVYRSGSLHRGAPSAPSPAKLQRAKVFANGRSQAVRLPKEFRLTGSEVLTRREGNRVILEPLPPESRDANGWPIGMWEELDALGGGADFPEVEPMPAGFLDPSEDTPRGRKTGAWPSATWSCCPSMNLPPSSTPVCVWPCAKRPSANAT